jgi:hypothetical protein
MSSSECKNGKGNRRKKLKNVSTPSSNFKFGEESDQITSFNT